MPRLDRLLACFCRGVDVAGGVEVIQASPGIAVQPGIHNIKMAHDRANAVMNLVDDGPIHLDRVTVSNQELPAAQSLRKGRCVKQQRQQQRRRYGL